MLETPHRRYNPLTREWTLVSPHRDKRPWLGQMEKPANETLPAYDKACYLCPGNERANGRKNPAYTGTYVFDNDFAALLPAPAEAATDIAAEPAAALFREESETGICRVICFSERHDLTFPQLSREQAASVVETWCQQTADLFQQPNIRHVQVFENKGAAMGCSNPHPHSQIWSQSQIPNEPAKELLSQQEYFARYARPLLLDYLAEEEIRKARIIAENEHFTAVVPFWAIWPFETLVVARRAVADLPSLRDAERPALAEILQQVTVRYDNLFGISFPYSMGFHQAPRDGEEHPEWVLHTHFYPPLLRSATIRKFMVGYEMLAMPQRDITPESAAARLRDLSEIHYTKR